VSSGVIIIAAHLYHALAELRVHVAFADSTPSAAAAEEAQALKREVGVRAPVTGGAYSHDGYGIGYGEGSNCAPGWTWCVRAVPEPAF
jgi:hypothetical protein